MTISSGTRLGPYEIIAPLGAGGMGEVFKARDTRLDRSVAIKILPARLSEDAQLKLRFEREAKTISQLNHPHICTLYDVGENYLVMELLEGESLADRLNKGPLPLDQVLRYGAQIAEALDKAHKAGVVHRDLKPGNIMITKGGAKLLDFGLAKPSEASALSALTSLRTEKRNLTEEGMIVGTFQYMAPEQLEGGEVDARTDIFALGSVLYEMATGKRAFEGKSKASLIASILTAEPQPITALQPMTPASFDRIVRSCLQKDPDDRWQSAHDVATELRWISESPASVERKRARSWSAWTLPVVTALVAAAMTWLILESRTPAARVIETNILPPPGWQFDFDHGNMVISPDSTKIAFLAHDEKRNTAMFVRELDSSNARPIAGTDEARYAFWSPDSRQLGYFAAGKLKIVEVSTGATRTIADAATPRGGTWSTAGIVFAPTATGPLFAVSPSGGVASPVTRLGASEVAHLFPTFMSDGRHFIYYSGAIDSALMIGSIAGGQPKRILSDIMYPGYTRPGFITLVNAGTLEARRIDEKTLQLVGSPAPVAEKVAAIGRRWVYSITDKILVYERGEQYVATQLVWVDRHGNQMAAVTPPGLFYTPRLSHDEKRVAVDISVPGTGYGNIWIFDLRRQTRARLTFGSDNESGPVWSADDQEVTFFSSPKGPTSSSARTANLFRIASGGTGEVQRLVENASNKMPVDVSRDGQWLFFVAEAFRGNGPDIWIYSERDHTAKPWLATPFAESAPALSPDGKWIAYQSNESGRNEVYVRSFPDSREKQLVSTAGGTMPAWRGDGRELYYIGPSTTMMAVPITVTPSFNAGTPSVLFDARILNHPFSRQYEVTSDGKRFLLNRRGEEKQEPMTVVQNWQQRLER